MKFIHVNEQANNKPGKLSISGTQVSFSPLPVSETASINYLDVDSTYRKFNSSSI